ncbi:restriction endonuclease [Aphanothece hegewaldii CCALA 016]|uniref:Restriction endonuclease n=1 Tax=Aphanothece hegewaldii CCALA 016 TaxID=2107694 RepID=A0A2T1M0C9_9CHRO|nr:restriction endonuclease [Aphanothece hegewaldii]PSF38129.1 restriction endonuclease [Aphanothece hegewaldii CCALA 016]
MSIPDFQTIMLPLLQYTEDEQEHSLRDSIEYLATFFKLTDSEKKHLLPSGQQATFDNRVGWASTYLKKAKFLVKTKRGYFKITERGQDVLKQKLSEINTNFLNNFAEFRNFQSPQNSNDLPRKANNGSLSETERTPEESLEMFYQKIRESLAYELLEAIKSCSPEFFEKLVVELLIKMGYGGSRKEAGQAVGQSRDGGIDGIIKEDRLGLDIIYIQAKRWNNTVSRPEIQKFAGALLGQKAKKGIFITTFQFSKDAIDYAKNLESKIILIDGQALTELMIDYNVGVSPIKSYEVKKIDIDYFTE